MWAFIVWVKKLGKHIKTTWQCISRVISWVGLVARWVMRCLLALDSSAFSMCFSRGISRIVHSQASHEVLYFSQLFTKLSHSTLTINPTNIQGNDWLITIKFDTELKPTKHNWKSQLYRLSTHYPSHEFQGKTFPCVLLHTSFFSEKGAYIVFYE